MKRAVAPAEIGFDPMGTVGGPVVLVEDDEILWPFLVALLESKGFEVLRVAEGEEALELLGETAASLLILDANISSPGATEFLRRLQRSDDVSRLPILCLVMPGQSGLRQITRKLGVDEFISEPFEPSAIVAAATRLARERKLA